MDRNAVIASLLLHKARLQAMGLKRVSLFGSTARGLATPGSDIDLAVTFDDAAEFDLFRFAAMTEQLSALLGSRVDVVVEPARNPRMQTEIDRDRFDVF